MDEPDLREMYAQRAKNLGVTAEAHEAQILALTPLRKYAKHEEVAKAALFLHRAIRRTLPANRSMYRAGV